MVYKMVQQKKKMEETKSKSATVLPKSTSDTPIVKMISDSKLLDPPPQYAERDLDREYRIQLYHYQCSFVILIQLHTL